VSAESNPADSAERRIGWRQILAGSRSVPRLPWTAAGTWRPTTLGGLALIFGLTVFGIGEGMVLQSAIGNSPWTVLAQGLSLTLHLEIGITTFAVSSAVLLLWWPLRERPGLGTVANVVVIAAALDATSRYLPTAQNHTASIAYAVTGTLLVGVGSGLYLTTGLGPGPRDGLMTSLHRRTGWPVARVRLVIEITVLTVGWALGGTIGLGTLIFALLVPRAVAWGLALVARVAATPV